jgi:hypothetical protein
MSDTGGGNKSSSRWMHVALVLWLSLGSASLTCHLLSSWLGLRRIPNGFLGDYRRVGPETGPQVLCVGSSLLISAVRWSKVSAFLGQGIETWAIGGSSPDVWEVWQQQRPRDSVTIVGVSVYDLNEMHLADDRATVVPLFRTIQDLLDSKTDSGLCHRILTQYALRYVRFLFPTAGASDRVQAELRRKFAEVTGHQNSLAVHEGVVLEPPPPVLEGGESKASIVDWSTARLLRRTASMREENQSRHDFFHGPKYQALHRIILRARQQGSVILVVLPVSDAYKQAFLSESDTSAFERAIEEARATAPDVRLVRLDHLPGISDSDHFVDLVHLNSAGRDIATPAFLTAVGQKGAQPPLARLANYGQ